MNSSFQQTSSGGIKSPFASRARQNVGLRRTVIKSANASVSGRSTQSIQIILKSQHNYVERFGQPLPVLVTEALTFAERNAVVTARISECGYAWVVCGRRLLIWQYKQFPTTSGTPQRKTNLSQCFELQLPQSDLAHRAELVSVFIVNRSHSPSCIAVSPEGVLRYWSGVVHESVYIEETVDLQGEECDSLTDVEGLGCILATTTCTVILVQPQLSAGRYSLQCKPLRVPTGWLGGISKRMSFIFGPLSSDHTAETRLVRVLSVSNEDGSWTVYVLAGHSLQKWQLSINEPEQLIFVAELSRLVRESYQSTVWDSFPGNQSEIDLWLLDVQLDKDGIIVLAAAVNLHISPRVHYALICFPTKGAQAPVSIKDFYLFKLMGMYREDNPSECLSYRFLLSGTSAYLYNQKSIIVIKPQEEPDILEFTTSQDLLLGGSVCVNTPIFFSKCHGLVAVSSNDLSDFNHSMTAQNLSMDASVSETTVTNNLSIYNIDPDELHCAYTDTLGQMKAAFIFHIKNKQAAYQDIIQELFPAEIAPVASVDAVLDKVVVEMCKNLIDDIPAGDPRWNRDGQPGIGSSYAMQIINQLEDKQKALSLLMKFLKDSGLWNRLAAVTERDTVMATVHLIGEFSEKIIGAIILKNLCSSSVVEEAIEKAVQQSNSYLVNGLTSQDAFFREITRVYRAIQELVNTCEDVAYSDASPTEIVQQIQETNDVILAVYRDVINYRQSNADSFTPSEAAVSLGITYLPWTIAPGDQGLGDSLLQQHSITHSYGVKLSSNEQEKNVACDQLVSLTDFILDGRKCHLESLKSCAQESFLHNQYVADRHKLIKPLLQEKEYERAAQLAEKYLDFEALTLICEATNNQQRLDEYIDRFNNDGFTEYVYNWFLKENKQGKLIDRCRRAGKTKRNEKLTQFVTAHPSLAWIQQIFNHKFDVASNTLRKLAIEETESLTRQKTMFSLAKLSNLASSIGNEESVFIKNINSQLDLIVYQEQLPDYVLQEFGYDTVRPRVLPPKELIKLYICPEFKEAGEVEFKKALDLLEFVMDVELREELKFKIWRTSILRDSWDFRNLDSPLEVLQNTLFFKIIDLSILLGNNPYEFLPPLDLLMDDESMRDFQENDSFQFLIKTGYEHVFRESASH